MVNTNQAKKILNFLLAILIVFFVSFLDFKFIVKNFGELSPDRAIVEENFSLPSVKDPAECDSVDKIVNGISYKALCLNNIYYRMIADNPDFSLCGKMVDVPLESCRMTVISFLLAKERKLSTCDNVPETLKSLCLDMYWNFMAVDQKNPAFCANILTPDLNLGCQNNVLLSLAGQKGSLICSSFSDGQIKADCENYLKGKDGCASIQNNLLKNICLRGR